MFGIKKVLLPALPLVVSGFLAGAVIAQDVPQDTQNDYLDEPAKVARVKLLEGDAVLKRIDSEDWEKAEVNLPLVEGDELQTREDSRIEVQFDNETYLRLDGSSDIKFTILGDEGIALSLSKGSALLSVLTFDPDAGYLEVDAPQTTVAITKEGKYRIDAGNDFDQQVSVSVWDGGTARVYSLDSGFTLKSDQTASMNLDGTYAGKWEVARTMGSFDDFDQWSAERDDFISKSLADAHYGQYYDSDMYGADDLGYYGSWQYNNDYGYLWTPYNSALSTYSNWSPYRYGQWRWLPYYGWTWVNDEPWGWSTYHYGRWIFLNGRWYWTPYSYYSYYNGRRSWWRPAIVYISSIGSQVYWYPLPYNYSYYNYNRRYRDRWRRYRRPHTNRRAPRNTPSTPNTPTTPNAANVARSQRLRTPPFQRMPAGSVIAANRNIFGTKKRVYDTAPTEISKQVLNKKLSGVDQTPPILPDRRQTAGDRTPDIIVRDQKRIILDRKTKIGAADRKSAQPLDKQLQKKRIYGNRPSQITIPSTTPGRVEKNASPRTGVFDRSGQNKKVEPGYTPPIYTPNRTATPKPNTRKADPNASPPIYTPVQPRRTEKKTTPPVYVPPQRNTTPQKREAPRTTYPTPSRRSQPSPSRTTPPAKSAPTRKAPSKSPPPKAYPKSDTKPVRKPPLSD